MSVLRSEDPRNAGREEPTLVLLGYCFFHLALRSSIVSSPMIDQAVEGPPAADGPPPLQQFTGRRKWVLVSAPPLPAFRSS